MMEGEHSPVAGSVQTFADYARKHFHGGIPTSFHRKELNNPVLIDTPDSEKEAAKTLFKVLMRYMGDQSDYRINMKFSHQPNLGSVMGRLYKDLGVSVTDGHMRRLPHLNADENVEENMKQLPTRPKRGTLRKLKATLTLRLFRNKKNTVFHLLPLEETLQTDLEQIHFIVGHGILRPKLRDEIYCQICKQLIDNPFKSSITKGWLLLQMVASCFCPSDNVKSYIYDFVDKGPPIWASNIRKVFQRTAKNGTRFQPPAQMELESVTKKQPLELEVTLMDGTEQVVVVDAATLSREFVNKLCHLLGMKEKFGFSVFVSMFDKVASLGNGNDHVMDAISQCEQMFCDQEGRGAGQAPWRLFFRKEIFSPWENTTHDPVATNLIFAQVIRGIMLGEYVCEKDEDLALLAAQQYFIEYGIGISEESLSAVLPSYIPPERREETDALKNWRRSVMKIHKDLFASKKESQRPGPYRVRLDIVKYALMTWPGEFSRYYDVRRLEGPDWEEDTLTLAVNACAVFIQGPENRLLYEMQYPQISTLAGERTEGTSQIITFILLSGVAIKLEAVDAEDIRYLVTFLMDGLRQRSTYAVAIDSHQDVSPEELSVLGGDLLLLAVPAKDQALKRERCEATNARTQQSGTIPTHNIYVLPTVQQPSDSTLALFRAHGVSQLGERNGEEKEEEESHLALSVSDDATSGAEATPSPRQPSPHSESHGSHSESHEIDRQVESSHGADNSFEESHGILN